MWQDRAMLSTLAALSLLGFGPTTLPASSPLVHQIGRFDSRDALGPRCAWSASALQVQVKASEITATIREAGTDFVEVVVDGKPTKTLALKQGESTYTVNLGSDGWHTVQWVKRTEALVGTVQFVSFSIPNGEFKRSAGAKRRIEVIGDSITCGYGNEGLKETEHFRPDTENAYQAYGPIAARALKAEWTLISWSGRKMYPDNTIPEIYDLILPNDPTSVWKFTAPAPDVVVINLATNDFGPGNPEETAWTGAYQKFIARLRTHYPKAMVYCAIGSMMSDDWPADRKSLSTLRGYLNRMIDRIHANGDKNVAVMEFAQQQAADGIGSDWHPNIKTMNKMADVLVKTVKKDLGW